MSYTSFLAKYTPSEKMVHKCKAVRRCYTNFAGSNVPPLSKEQYKKAMKGYFKKKEEPWFSEKNLGIKNIHE